MPLDGTDYQPEMGLEEKALRYALAFYTSESKWISGMGAMEGGAKCVGCAVRHGANYHEPSVDHDYIWAGAALGLTERGQYVAFWNYDCPSFAALKDYLRTRIKHYEDQRLKVLA